MAAESQFDTIPFFRAFPQLGERLPREDIGDFPTPVRRLERLGERLGLDNLWVKHDGFSGRPYGGNKVRKLAYLLADARRMGAKEVLTFGGAGSNHALATTIYARSLGMDSIAVLGPQPPEPPVRKTLLLQLRYGATIVPIPDYSLMNEAADKIARDRAVRELPPPYVIPIGGTTPLGTSGFVEAAYELREQVRAGIFPEPDVVYVPLGSMGTAVGLHLGLRAAGMRTQVAGVRVVTDTMSNEASYRCLYADTAAFLHGLDPSFPALACAPEDTDIRHDRFGPGYGVYTPDGTAAVALMGETEGIALDGVYTGKTLAALIGDAESGALDGKTVLFWETLNAHDLTAETEGLYWKELPEGMWGYWA